MSKIPSLEEMLKLYTKKDLWERIQQHIQTIDQLKQQLAEKDKEIKKLNWQLKDKDFIIKNLNHSLSVAPNANAGQRARVDELTKIVKEKDKEIEKLKLKLDIRAMSLQNINIERMEAVRNQTQLAIAELEQDLEFTTKTANELIEIKHKLEQELAELKEKYIIPKFQLGQTIFTANKPNECIYELKIVSIHIERSEFYDRKFNSLVYLAERIKDGYIGGYPEEDLFATEQEAQDKLKEIQGNE